MGVIRLHDGNLYGPVYGPDYPATKERSETESERYKRGLEKRFEKFSRLELIQFIELHKSMSNHYRTLYEANKEKVVEFHLGESRWAATGSADN